MTQENREQVYQSMRKSITKRLQHALPGLAEDVLAGMSLACILNLLFLLQGQWGSIGDFMTTSKAVRAAVGENLFWSEPAVQEPGAAVGLVH